MVYFFSTNNKYKERGIYMSIFKGDENNMFHCDIFFEETYYEGKSLMIGNGIKKTLEFREILEFKIIWF